MAKKVSEQQARDFLTEHLPYEVQMLRDTFRLLGQSKPGPMQNALIEAFCVHARNLIEFFKNKPDCDFDPRHFAKEGYQLRKSFVCGSRVTRINEQISHLSRDRTVERSKKIGSEMRAELLESIEDELERLRSELDSPYDELWCIGRRYHLPPAPPNATGAIASVSVTTSTHNVVVGFDYDGNPFGRD